VHMVLLRVEEMHQKPLAADVLKWSYILDIVFRGAPLKINETVNRILSLSRVLWYRDE
jgi:hypothetical protein